MKHFLHTWRHFVYLIQFTFSLFWGGAAFVACNDDDNMVNSGHNETESFVQRLDSTITQSNSYYGKRAYSYNEKGLVDTMFVIDDYHTEFDFLPGLNHYDSYAEAYTYDANDSLIRINSFPIGSEGISRYAYKTEYVRNDKGQKNSKITTEVGVEKNDYWYGEDRVEYSYDASGNLVSMLHYYLYVNQGTAENRNRIEYTYDNRNNKLTEVAYRWDFYNQDWEFYYNDSYTYNQKSQLVERVSCQSGSPKKRVTYSYDENGNCKLETHSITYDDLNWGTNEQIEFYYDDSNHLISTNQSRSVNGSLYFNVFYKTIISYDAYGNETEANFYNFEELDWVLFQTRKSYYSVVSK